MTNPSDSELSRQIRRLLDQAGIPVDVEVRDGVARLLGPVDSTRLYQAALDIANSVDGVRAVDDQMEYEVIAPDMVTEEPDVDGDYGYADAEALDDDVPDYEPNFEDDVDSDDWQQVIEEGGTYFPPTDPVVRPSRGEEALEVVGGFQATSMENDDEAGIEDEEVVISNGEIIIDRDDDEIREDVIRELAEDALTTDLDLVVNVVNGVVFLHGTVQSLDDAENAEAVASRVPGIREVRDMTEVEAG